LGENGAPPGLHSPPAWMIRPCSPHKLFSKLFITELDHI
jgi:hypothetical protein